MADRRDLFGRTEAQLVDAIARGESKLEIQSVWRGNDTLGAEVKSARMNIEVDRRCLAKLRGERVEQPVGWRPDLEGEALEKFRREILRMGYHSQRRSK